MLDDGGLTFTGSNGAVWAAGCDAFSLATSSSVQSIELAAQSTNVDPSSTHRVVAGTTPLVDTPPTWADGQDTEIVVTTAPNTTWLLIGSPNTAWFPLDFVGFSMPLLLDPGALVPLGSGVHGAGTTTVLPFQFVFAAPSEGLTFNLQAAGLSGSGNVLGTRTGTSRTR